ncbi:MAG: hypothetical protein HYZ29_06230 [Myxococcales bacterium]|nr:hypothetical protein [Myxococcales bacterium]
MKKLAYCGFHLATLFGACGRKTRGPASDSSCTRDLVKYCAEGGCASFEKRSAELRDQVAAHRDGGSCLSRASIGTCGDYKYVDFSDGFHGRTAYFDSTGRQVAAVMSTDIIDECKGKVVAGTAPTCTLAPTETMCPDGGP